jgi:hypothetical protein
MCWGERKRTMIMGWKMGLKTNILGGGGDSSETGGGGGGGGYLEKG